MNLSMYLTLFFLLIILFFNAVDNLIIENELYAVLSHEWAWFQCRPQTRPQSLKAACFSKIFMTYFIYLAGFLIIQICLGGKYHIFLQCTLNVLAPAKKISTEFKFCAFYQMVTFRHYSKSVWYTVVQSSCSAYVL